MSLFNDDVFKPQPVETLKGGVTTNFIESINPTWKDRTRDSLFLSQNFGKVKFLYRIKVSNYSATPQVNPDAFVNFTKNTYVMYAHCLIGDCLFMETLAMRELYRDKQWEEGMSCDIKPLDILF